MVTQLKIIQNNKVKGKSASRTHYAVHEMDHFITFNRGYNRGCIHKYGQCDLDLSPGIHIFKDCQSYHFKTLPFGLSTTFMEFMVVAKEDKVIALEIVIRIPRRLVGQNQIPPNLSPYSNDYLSGVSWST